MSVSCPVERGVLDWEFKDVIVAIGKSSDSSWALNFSSFSRWATFSSLESFSNLTILTDRFIFGGSFSYSFWAWSPNAFSAPWFISSRKSGTFIVLGSKTKRCHLCLAVACDSSLTYLRPKITNKSSRVYLLTVLIFLNVCRAFLLSNEWKWLTFVCSDISGCILIIVWKRFSNSSNYSLLPSKVRMLELNGQMVSCWAVGRFCMLVKTSASLLIGSCSGAGTVLSCTWIVVSSKGLRSS